MFIRFHVSQVSEFMAIKHDNRAIGIWQMLYIRKFTANFMTRAFCFRNPFKATHFIATQLELAVETLKISRFLYVFNL